VALAALVPVLCVSGASVAQDRNDYTRSLQEATLILHDVHHGQFAVMPGLALLNFDINLTRRNDMLTSCSWYVCTSRTEVRISDLDTCTAQFNLPSGPPTVSSRRGATWRFYFLNNVLKDEIDITPFPGRGFIIYRVKLTGENNIYCSYLEESHGRIKGRCTNQIMMYVSDDKIRDFKAVLTYILEDVCTGAKRERDR
jgi:hypothetical protein